jgi:hypothetical protein
MIGVTGGIGRIANLFLTLASPFDRLSKDVMSDAERLIVASAADQRARAADA